MSFRKKHSSKALAILLFVMATIVAVGLNPTVVGNAAPIKQEAQPAKKQERQGLKPTWKDAGPDSSWSFFDRKKTEPKVAKSKPRSYISLQAWQQFAASKGVSLEGIPEELLLELLHIRHHPFGVAHWLMLVGIDLGLNLLLSVQHHSLHRVHDPHDAATHEVVDPEHRSSEGDDAP